MMSGMYRYQGEVNNLPNSALGSHQGRNKVAGAVAPWPSKHCSDFTLVISRAPAPHIYQAMSTPKGNHVTAGQESTCSAQLHSWIPASHHCPHWCEHQGSPSSCEQAWWNERDSCTLQVSLSLSLPFPSDWSRAFLVETLIHS